MDPTIYYLPVFAVIFVLVAFWYKKLKKEPDGPSEDELNKLDEPERKILAEIGYQMRYFSTIIREGVQEFAKFLFKRIAVVTFVLSAAISCALEVWSGPKFLFGSGLSSASVIVGLVVAAIANIRVTERARRTGKIGRTVAIALDGGKIVGVVSSSFGALGALILYIIQKPTAYSVGHGIFASLPCNAVITGLVSYSLGYSLVAMFCRVAGGVLTKMADIAADIVGKIYFDMPEDDARNPATAADGAGDIIADCASNIADMGESYVATLVSALAASVYFQQEMLENGFTVTDELFEALRAFPVFVSVMGLVASVLGLIITSKRKMSEEPEKELNIAMYISATLTALFVLGGSYYYFGNVALPTDFRFGWASPLVVVVVGVLSGIAIGRATEYFTSPKYSPVKELARKSYLGPAFNTTKGDAIGFKSALSGLIIAISIAVVQWCSGQTYGIAMAALGMMSFIATTVAIDAFGPISDNAGGITEASGLPESVRDITDAADRAGNTTAAIGKGFAISGAAYATLSMISTYGSSSGLVRGAFTLLDPMIIVGIFIGTIVIRYFESLLSDNTQDGAQFTADDCVEQIKAMQEGKINKPDHKGVIKSSSRYALSKMYYPALLCLIVTVVVGVFFGRASAAGLQIGMVAIAVVDAFAMGNSGGAYDNAKKYVECGDFARDQTNDLWNSGLDYFKRFMGDRFIPVDRGSLSEEDWLDAVKAANFNVAFTEMLKFFGKGTEVHKTTIAGDTKGDTMKDVICVCLDIFIKMVATSSVIMLPIFKASEKNVVAKIVVACILAVVLVVKFVRDRRYARSPKALRTRVEHEIFAYVDRQKALEEIHNAV